MNHNTLIFLLLLSRTLLSQTTHDVTVTNFQFIPQTLTINTGDAVRWINMLGHHNVKADNNSFTSGPAAPAPWEFIHTFTVAGNNPYYCEPHGGPGGSGMAGVIIVQNPVGVDDVKFIADKFELLQNFPNPFNPRTNIEFRISDRVDVSLKVYNILGDEVATLVNEEKEQGIYNFTFDATGLSSGIYFYKIQAGEFYEIRKMTFLK